MKKFIILFTLISCILVSCTSRNDNQHQTANNSRERILEKLNSQKNTLFVTTKFENSKELKGVKNLKTEEMVIPYGEYADIKIDNVIIKTTNKNKQIFVYNHQGTLIGGMSFDSFVRIKTDKTEGYYLGTKYDKKYYYFHTTKTFINPVHNLVTHNEICLVTKDKILFYNHDGKFSWQTTNEDVYLLQTTDKQNNRLYVITKIDDNTYQMHNSSGAVIKTYTHKELRSFLNPINKTKIDKFYYVEIEKL